MFGQMLWGYPLKFRPKKLALYMLGTSNQSDPEMAIDIMNIIRAYFPRSSISIINHIYHIIIYSYHVDIKSSYQRLVSYLINIIS